MLSQLLLIVVVFLSIQASPQGVTSHDSSTILKLGIVQENVAAKGLAERGCLIVHGDGDYRFEQRRQQTPSVSNDLNVYEGKLDVGQLNELVEILNKPEVRTLPDYVPPRFPISTATFEMLTAEVSVNGVPRHVGYFNSAGSITSGTSPENTPDNIKNDWSNSRSVLQPLASWFRKFKNGSLERVTSKESSCV